MKKLYKKSDLETSFTSFFILKNIFYCKTKSEEVYMLILTYFDIFLIYFDYFISNIINLLQKFYFPIEVLLNSGHIFLWNFLIKIFLLKNDNVAKFHCHTVFTSQVIQ